MDDYEVVEGAVSEINEFGAFVRIGPMEALLHKSQIMEDTVEANIGKGMIEGRKTGKQIGVGSFVRARIVSLSPDTSDPRRSKIGLTSKQPGLGCPEWKRIDKNNEGSD
jgi:DNA-directed RNA polymerase subunit E'